MDQAQRIQDLQECNFDGNLLWKVQLQELQGALAGQQEDGEDLQLHSPVFYTGRPGYKLSISLNIPAEQDGSSAQDSRKTALHVRLHKGTFDERLHFPFKGTCKVQVQSTPKLSTPNPQQGKSYDIRCRNMAQRVVEGGEHSNSNAIEYLSIAKLMSKEFIIDGAINLLIQFKA